LYDDFGLMMVLKQAVNDTTFFQQQRTVNTPSRVENQIDGHEEHAA